jgi:hypothetical protein
MAISESATIAGIEPFYTWHTPIAWTGYIAFVDGLVWYRVGSSWVQDARPEFVFLAAVSVPSWVVFELYNRYAIYSWYYVGLPESRPLRSFGYVWSFATISPALFETGDLVSSFRRPLEDRPSPRPSRLTIGAWASIAVGAFMLALPFLWLSPWLAAPVFLGFVFLLDPINASAGDESILGDLRRGQTRRLVNLLAAGLLCGLVWELWNYRAGAKWIYNVPILSNVKVFEMPILGFGGFPPFALECFTMYVLVRRWLWRGARRPISV